MKKVEIGQLSTWANIVTNARAQGYTVVIERSARVPAREDGNKRYTVEWSKHGTLEVYEWSGDRGTMVARID